MKPECFVSYFFLRHAFQSFGEVGYLQLDTGRQVLRVGYLVAVGLVDEYPEIRVAVMAAGYLCEP